MLSLHRFNVANTTTRENLENQHENLDAVVLLETKWQKAYAVFYTKVFYKKERLQRFRNASTVLNQARNRMVED